jgi:AraC family transcriptional regulator
VESDLRPDNVKIVIFPETRVAALEHRGAPALIDSVSVPRFVAWRKANRLTRELSATFNVLHDDPDTAPRDTYRFDLCAATDGPVDPNPFGVVAKTIPGGRCAVLRHHGSDATLGAALAYLCTTWLPASGERRRDYPLFLQRVSFGPGVPEDRMVTDLFLPLA